MGSIEATMGVQATERWLAEERHSIVRAAAATQTATSILEELGIAVGIRPIGESDIARANTWTFGGEAPGWCWANEVKRLRQRTRRLEAAIVVNPPGGELCGLLLGRISDRKVVASLHFLHRAPNPNPLGGQFALIAVRYLEFCATAYKCKTMRLRDPIEAVVPLYERLGFKSERAKKGKIKWLNRDVL